MLASLYTWAFYHTSHSYNWYWLGIVWHIIEGQEFQSLKWSLVLIWVLWPDPVRASCPSVIEHEQTPWSSPTPWSPTSDGATIKLGAIRQLNIMIADTITTLPVRRPDGRTNSQFLLRLMPQCYISKLCKNTVFLFI